MRAALKARRTRAMVVVVLATAALVPAATLVAGPAAQSSAMSMGVDHCQLTQLAFCDTFQTIVGGGREGNLDPAKWSFTRVSQQNNPYQGQIDNYAPRSRISARPRRSSSPTPTRSSVVSSSMSRTTGWKRWTTTAST